MSTPAVLDDRDEWHQDALRWIETYALSGLTFTVEDVRAALRPAPSGSCYGNAFQAARKAGVITCAGYRESTTPSRKSGIIRVWVASPKETS
ncbi:hypothetical protein [Arthrobacter roseus]|uniref:hypothetical protein n=1 Tax=Arthrobacter roseus TaxID=136274 RepID=UPI001964C1B9|nr:hypothetical protein [Arthrobacter roseus]MBM7847508.1 hypothetical protein [Arthrobacter roseus]